MAGGNLYTKEEDAAIIKAASSGEYAWAVTLAKRIGRSPSSIINRGKFLRARPITQLTRSVHDSNGVRIFAPLVTAKEPDDAFLERVFNTTDDAVAKAQAEPYVRVRIESDVPIGFTLASDMHLTAKGATDVRGIFDLGTTVRDTPGMYLALVGDQFDNPVKHDPTEKGDVPDELRLLDLFLGRVGDKLLGMTSGNHDDWTKTAVGVDNLQTLADRHALHYVPDELVWVVEIVRPGTDDLTARWIIATRHQYYRNSNLNYCHACWRWLEDNQNNWPSENGMTLLPDVVAIGHNHVAAVEARPTKRGTVVACRMGAWQYSSRFTRQKGYVLSPPMAPTMILPNIRDGSAEIEPVVDYRIAAERLAAKAPKAKRKRA